MYFYVFQNLISKFLCQSKLISFLCGGRIINIMCILYILSVLSDMVLATTNMTMGCTLDNSGFN